jgi:hypothetical protein
VCGHPRRKASSSEVVFCRCCEALLTETERDTLHFYGREWRAKKRDLNERLGKFGEWERFTIVITNLLRSLRAEPKHGVCKEADVALLNARPRQFDKDGHPIWRVKGKTWRLP